MIFSELTFHIKIMTKWLYSLPSESSPNPKVVVGCSALSHGFPCIRAIVTAANNDLQLYSASSESGAIILLPKMISRTVSTYRCTSSRQGSKLTSPNKYSANEESSSGVFDALNNNELVFVPFLAGDASKLERELEEEVGGVKDANIPNPLLPTESVEIFRPVPVSDSLEIVRLFFCVDNSPGMYMALSAAESFDTLRDFCGEDSPGIFQIPSPLPPDSFQILRPFDGDVTPGMGIGVVYIFFTTLGLSGLIEEEVGLPLEDVTCMLSTEEVRDLNWV